MTATNGLIQQLEHDLALYRAQGLRSEPTDRHIPTWRRKLEREPARFINSDQTVNVEVLRNFRRAQVFIPDNPDHALQRPSLKNLLGGGRRGERRMLRECLEIFLEVGDGALLRQYPCPPVGNPHVFRYRGYRYTHRWLKHVYFLGLLKRVVGDQLPRGAAFVDIGSSYGIFSSLVQQELPGSHHILVDFAEQLLLARYFLQSYLPNARIAGIQEIGEAPSISRALVEAYDFLLVPCPLFRRLEGGCADVVTNFASLGEMPREWFDTYLRSEVFRQATFFLTANRIQSRPTFDTDLTILDYPIWDPAKRLHFAISPLFSSPHRYVRRHLVFYDRFSSHPYFEYLGRV